jgi:hypothetical protein
MLIPVTLSKIASASGDDEQSAIIVAQSEADTHGLSQQEPRDTRNETGSKLYPCSFSL